MNSSEPFLPVKHSRTDEIDAADPGLGAPGTIPPPDATDDELNAQQDEFQKRMDQERDHDSLFRTPHPDGTSR